MDYNKYLEECKPQARFISINDLNGATFCIKKEPEENVRVHNRNKSKLCYLDIIHLGEKRICFSYPQFSKIVTFMQKHKLTWGDYFTIKKIKKIEKNNYFEYDFDFVVVEKII